jgi:hypothetical protein
VWFSIWRTVTARPCRRQIRQVLADGVVEAEPALLDEVQGNGAVECF